MAILRALLAEYDLLFLDEPFKGLDRETKETVMADTRRRCAGRTVLLVTHDVAELDAMGAVVRLEFEYMSAIRKRRPRTSRCGSPFAYFQDK